jgi:transposase
MKEYTNSQRIELEEQLKRRDIGSKFLRRIQAVYWRKQGRTLREVAELSGYSLRTVFRLCGAYEERGLEGLRSHCVGSNNRKLSHEAEAAVLEKLSVEAVGGISVRASELLKRFEELAGVSYNIDAFYRLLHRHGWRKVMPRGQHPKAADEETREAAKKLT